jgi:NAD(P)-dependent dehydrogenase (short-subunit alcohol dehydrogenase family)
MHRSLIRIVIASTVLAVGLPASAAFDPDSPTVMITGSNRGIGLAFAKHYAAEGWNVIATARSPERADDLKALQGEYPQVAIEQLDVTSLEQIDALAEAYRGRPIDVLINNAAVLGDLPAQKVGGLDREEFEKVMTVNVFGPLKVSEAFAEHVASSDQKKIVALTSGLGSLRLMGRMSGFYYYRMSKAALNMGMLGLRTDLKDRGIIVGIVAPGMVNTQLLADSGYDGRSLEPEDSAAGMAGIIAALTAEDKGKPINVDGNVIPW